MIVTSDGRPWGSNNFGGIGVYDGEIIENITI